ncbi:hypothetical protein AKJ16_DCAP18645 [Drosera capensis]
MMLKTRGNANKDENGTLECLENLVVCIALMFTMLVDVEFVRFGGWFGKCAKPSLYTQPRKFSGLDWFSNLKVLTELQICEYTT